MMSPLRLNSKRAYGRPVAGTSHATPGRETKAEGGSIPMRRIKMTLAVACAALTLTAAMAAAQAVPPDRTTYVTFSGPVSIPGMTLPAGTYTFRIMDSQTDRHIVQIFDKEGA